MCENSSQNVNTYPAAGLYLLFPAPPPQEQPQPQPGPAPREGQGKRRRPAERPGRLQAREPGRDWGHPPPGHGEPHGKGRLLEAAPCHPPRWEPGQEQGEHDRQQQRRGLPLSPGRRGGRLQVGQPEAPPKEAVPSAVIPSVIWLFSF